MEVEKILMLQLNHYLMHDKVFELPKPTQAVQPYEYGHKYSKRTLLWLKNLPNLKPYKDEPMKKINNYKQLLPSNTGGKKFGKKYSFSKSLSISLESLVILDSV